MGCYELQNAGPQTGWAEESWLGPRSGRLQPLLHAFPCRGAVIGQRDPGSSAVKAGEMRLARQITEKHSQTVSSDSRHMTGGLGGLRTILWKQVRGEAAFCTEVTFCGYNICGNKTKTHTKGATLRTDGAAPSDNPSLSLTVFSTFVSKTQTPIGP